MQTADLLRSASRPDVGARSRYLRSINDSHSFLSRRILLDIDQKMMLEKLPISEGASFESHAEEHNATCLPDTRKDLLEEIHTWARNPSAEAIFWLKGMAGTGKSTVSRTIAQSFKEGGCLGATFFFKTGESDRSGLSKFCTTVISQLVSYIPGLALHVKNILDSDSQIVRKSVQEQFKNLILEPLSKVPKVSQESSTFIIVVDALDECEKDADIKLLIQLFSRVKNLPSLHLKVFVTSRPETPIRLGFSAIGRNTYHDLVLHDIPEPVIKHDIRLFLMHNFAEIRTEFNYKAEEEHRLPAAWPGELTIRALTRMAVPLFIFAATVCRYVRDDRFSPIQQLNDVLKYQTQSQTSQFDAIYGPIVEKLVRDLEGRKLEEIKQRFHLVVGSIVVLASPLSVAALSGILDMDKDSINGLLGSLHSVLSISKASTSPVRLLHLSFRDFLLAPETNKRWFWIDEKLRHKEIFENCLRAMNRSLHRDICHKREPGTPISAIEPDCIKKYLPSEVQYACRYWIYHFEKSEGIIQDDDAVDRFLRCHLLHWLESLCILGVVHESVEMIGVLLSMLQASTVLFSTRY